MLSIFDNYLNNILMIVTKSKEVDFKKKEEIKFLFKNKFEIENVFLYHEKNR